MSSTLADMELDKTEDQEFSDEQASSGDEDPGEDIEESFATDEERSRYYLMTDKKRIQESVDDWAKGDKNKYTFEPHDCFVEDELALFELELLRPYCHQIEVIEFRFGDGPNHVGFFSTNLADAYTQFLISAKEVKKLIYWVHLDKRDIEGKLEKIKIISTFLAQTKSLEFLELFFADILTEEEINVLAKGLSSNKSLKEVKLIIKTGSSACKTLASALVHPTIISLDLYGSFLAPEAIKNILEGIAQNKILQTLSLEEVNFYDEVAVYDVLCDKYRSGMSIADADQERSFENEKNESDKIHYEYFKSIKSFFSPLLFKLNFLKELILDNIFEESITLHLSKFITGDRSWFHDSGNSNIRPNYSITKLSVCVKNKELNHYKSMIDNLPNLTELSVNDWYMGGRKLEQYFQEKLAKKKRNEIRTEFFRILAKKYGVKDGHIRIGSDIRNATLLTFAFAGCLEPGSKFLKRMAQPTETLAFPKPEVSETTENGIKDDTGISLGTEGIEYLGAKRRKIESQ